MSLRPYQVEAIEKCRAEFRRGSKRVVLVMPTGAGKTRVGGEVVRGAVAKGNRVLWLAHRRELVDQSCQTLEANGIRVGAIAASARHPERPEESVQVASIQTLVSRPDRRPKADLILWDECHHASEAAETWSEILAWYPGVLALGLTATPERGDGYGLAPLFDALVVGATIQQLTKDGFLVPSHVIRPSSKLKPGQIAQHPLDAYCQHTPGQQAFLFCRTVDDANEYADAFTMRGIRSACVHASTPKEQRRKALEDFRSGLVRVLTNVFVFTEGTDMPMASACIMARGAGTVGIYLQMVGRVLRPAPGKTMATIIDLNGVSHKHGMPDDHRVWSIDGKACQGATAAPSMLCKVCGELIAEYPCDACGYAGPAPVDTQITGDELKFAKKRAENESERWSTLTRWAAICVAKGYKSGWLYAKYKHVYGSPPPDDWVFKAVRVARGDKKVAG